MEKDWVTMHSDTTRQWVALGTWLQGTGSLGNGSPGHWVVPPCHLIAPLPLVTIFLYLLNLNVIIFDWFLFRLVGNINYSLTMGYFMLYGTFPFWSNFFVSLLHQTWNSVCLAKNVRNSTKLGETIYEKAISIVLKCFIHILINFQTANLFKTRFTYFEQSFHISLYN